MQTELIRLLTSGNVINIEAIPTLPVDSRPRPWECGRLEQGGGDSGSPFNFTPKRIQLNKEHEIFEDGDIHRHMYLQDLSISTAEADDAPKLCVSAFGCHISGCVQEFSSVEEYEHHYNSLHRHVCSCCRRSLPSARLLDIHIQEWHDPLFSLLATKQDMYQCVVEGCDLKFRTSFQRKDHLITIHKYPPDFRFDKAKKSQRTKEAKPQQPRDSSMEVCDEVCELVSTPPEEGECMEVHPTATPAPPHPTTTTPEQHRPRFSYRVPSSVCFGQGSVRGFRGRGRRK